jgi:hypothetical protein
MTADIEGCVFFIIEFYRATPASSAVGGGGGGFGSLRCSAFSFHAVAVQVDPFDSELCENRVFTS